MRKLLFIIASISCFISFGQAPAIEWQKVLGGSNEDRGYQVIETADNGYLISGTTFSNDGDVTGYHGGRDIWLTKLDASGVIQWQKTFGGSNNEDAIVKQTSDGGYIIAGSSNSNDGNVTNNNGSKDFWVVKTDTNGEILWEKSYGGSGGDVLSKILIDNTGGYIIFGYTNSFDGDVTGAHGMNDLWVVKINEEGIVQWEKALGGSANEIPQNILQTDDGEYLIYAQAYSDNGDINASNTSPKLWLVNLNNLGEINWQKIIGGVGQQDPVYIEQTSDGGCVISSVTNHVNGISYPSDILVSKIDSEGNIQWQNTYGGSDYEIGIVKQTNDGGYIISAFTYSDDGDAEETNGMAEILIIKLSSTGEREWVETYGGSNWDYFISPPDNYSYYFSKANIIETSDGYVISGVTKSTNSGDVVGGTGGIYNDIWTVKINLSGIIQWQKATGGSNEDIAHEIITTSDGGYAVIGSTYSNNGDIVGHHGNSDIFVIKFGPDTLGVKDIVTEHICIYPNPALSHFNIALPDNAVAETVSVIDVTGKTVLQAGAVTSVNIEKLQSGIYFIEIQCEDKVYKTKLIKN